MTSALLAVAILTLAGLPLASWLEPSHGWRWRTGAGFMIGSGIASMLMLLATFAGIDWSALLVVAALSLVALSTLPLVASLPKRHSSSRAQPLALVADAATLCSVAGYALFATVARPWEWDFWAMWGLKAKEFFIVRGVSFDYLSRADNVFSHPDYPPLVTLLYDFVALLDGRWDDRWMGVVSVAFSVALLLAVREELERQSGSGAVAAFGTLALSGVACSPWVGLAEGPLVAFAATGVLVLSRGLREGAARAIGAGSLLIGLAALTKNEGVSFAAAVVAATLLVAPRQTWRPALVVAALVAPWSVALRLNATSSELFEGSFAARVLERFADPAEFFATLARGQFERPWFWAILGIVLVVSPRTARRERFILFVIALQALAYLAIYAGTSHDFQSHVQGSLGRVSSQLAPMVAMVAILGLGELLTAGRRAESERERENDLEHEA